MRLREPLLLPFIAFAAGVAGATYWSLPLNQVLYAASACSVLALLAARLGRGAMRIATGAALLFLGFALVAAHPPVPPPTLSVPDNIPAILDGCVVDPALIAADRERFTVELAPGARSQVSL